MNTALVSLANINRPAKPSDDALRGLISECQWILDFEKRVIRATSEVITEQQQQADDASGIGSPMAPDPEVPTT
jgi:hypothetical protein